jgi:hypothetical protein
MFRSNGGFGCGHRIMMFLAGQWLNVAAMKAKPAVGIIGAMGVAANYFTEDGTFWAGVDHITYGMDHSPGVPLTGNHTLRDLAGVYDAHNLPVLEGAVVAASPSTVQLQPGSTGVEINNYQIAISSGLGAGQCKYVQGWNNTTKVITIGDVFNGPPGTWAITPNATSHYQYANGGGYQPILTRGVIASAIAVVIADHQCTDGARDIIGDWNNSVFFDYIDQWVNIQQGGFYPPWFYPLPGDGSNNTVFGGDRTAAYWPVAAPWWP